MQRRDFLKALGIVPLSPYISNLAFAASANYSNLLVLVELKGGNDGLNTVIPYADRNYYNLRPKLAVARDQVLPLSETTGLHPALAPLMPTWKSRELAIVQSVGYAQPNLSHFRSIEIWETASKSDEYLDEGWLSRLFAAQPAPKNFAADGVIVGSQELGPLAGSGTRAVALASTERFLRQSQLARDKVARAPNSALAHILKVEADIQQAAEGLKSEFVFRTEFPKSQFGEAVKTAAQVISSRAPVAVVRITLDGFDTHSNQSNRHGRLLTDLAEGLVALKSALIEINRWDSTLVMTYAEFGRRPRENQSGGTDHGTAGTHFLLGGKVAGGLHGQPPRLGQLDGNGNLPFAVDFRDLYATVIEKWWETPSQAALNGKFAALDLIKA